jgi:hypothetical protein
MNTTRATEQFSAGFRGVVSYKLRDYFLDFITRGLPQLHTLRDIMDEAYRLFDRRCWTETALASLAHLRARVQRFQKVGQTLQPLFSPNLEKALTFLDDRLLPATSNAVEHGNCRHRKMQQPSMWCAPRGTSSAESRWMCCATPRHLPGGPRLARCTGTGRLPPLPLANLFR